MNNSNLEFSNTSQPELASKPTAKNDDDYESYFDINVENDNYDHD